MAGLLAHSPLHQPSRPFPDSGKMCMQCFIPLSTGDDTSRAVFAVRRHQITGQLKLPGGPVRGSEYTVAGTASGFHEIPFSSRHDRDTTELFQRAESSYPPSPLFSKKSFPHCAVIAERESGLRIIPALFSQKRCFRPDLRRLPYRSAAEFVTAPVIWGCHPSFPFSIIHRKPGLSDKKDSEKNETDCDRTP